MTEDDEVVFVNDRGTVMGRVVPMDDDSVANFNETYVEASERGTGLAGRLMGQAARHLRFAGVKARATCPYAQRWFQKNPQYSDILVAE